MSNLTKKELIVHGVGKGVFKYSDGTFSRIEYAQSVAIEITSTEEDIYGGDGQYPIFSYIKEKGGTIKIVNATTTMDQLKLTQGAEIIEKDALVFKYSDVVTATAGSATLSETSGVDVSSVMAEVVDTGKILKRVSATPGAGEFSVTTSGAVTFGDEDLAGEVRFAYRHKDATAAMVRLRTDSVPGVVEYHHTLVTDELEGKRFEISLFIPKAKCSGTFSLTMDRSTATTPNLDFKILDAARDDKAYFDYSIKEISA